jgi:hypothetical protein
VIAVALIIDTWFHGHDALGLAFLRQYHPTRFPHLPPEAGSTPDVLVWGHGVTRYAACLPITRVCLPRMTPTG